MDELEQDGGEVESAEAAQVETPAAAPAPDVDAGPRDDIRAAITSLQGEDGEKGTGKASDRNAKGQFSKDAKPTKTATPGQQAVPDKKAAPVPPGGRTPAARPVDKTGAPSETELKPPGGWRPNARAKWGELPPEVQQEIKRHESLQATEGGRAAPALRFQGEFQQLLSPFEATMRAEAAARGEQWHPLRGFQQYLHTAQALRSAGPEQKAAMVVGVAGQYGVPPDALVANLINAYRGDKEALLDAVAARLQGQAPRGQPTQQQIDPAQIAAQIEQRILGNVQQRATQQRLIEYEGSLPAFFEEKGLADYWDGEGNTLGADMARFFDAGVAETLEEALSLALAMPKNKELSEVVAQRKAAEAAGQGNPSLQAAKAAAGSIRSTPAGKRPIPVSKAGDFNGTRKDDIRAAIARLASDPAR